MNVLAGIAVAGVSTASPAGASDGAVRSLRRENARGALESDGITIMNDSYNANPEAVRAMLDMLGSTPARRRIAVLGEMLELGRWPSRYTANWELRRGSRD